MTIAEIAALSLLEDLSRVDLTARLAGADPLLAELATPLRDRAVRVLERAAADGVGFLPWNAPVFPAALLATTDCPPGLWYRGEVSAFSGSLIAIVGSRGGSPAAREAATLIASGLAGHGLVVVSGLARGIDSAAHRGALETGKTIAVLGSGVDRIYPAEHRSLAATIAGNGLVLSEYPPGTPPLPFHFPLRNRLISGLSRAVVVIEAAENSGSLITAACALEQGRDVLVVPGNVIGGRNRGGHALIRDGARIVETADDILLELGLIQNPVRSVSGWTVDTSADPMLSRLDLGTPYDLDALSAQTGVDAVRLLPRLSEFELAGFIRRVDGGRFMRTR